jgi:hypothetical protein
MTFAHLIYIPIVLLVGLVLGFIWGRKAAITELEARARLAAEREAAREARRRARAASPDAAEAAHD